MAVFFFAASALVASAQTLTTLADFTAAAQPVGNLVQASDGNFYGTTTFGGANTNCGAPDGCGSIFKITPGGTLTTLYSFCPQGGCVDGFEPLAGLTQASDGNFYGTTSQGGANCPPATNCGTVFQITLSGVLTTLYTFCSQANCADGSSPEGGVIQATDGNFYGTTFTGGANNDGTVFQITAGGTLTKLYDFCTQANCSDGVNPTGNLLQATDGDFYGTTNQGGTNGDGTLFKITAGGALTSLYSFCPVVNCPDGSNPNGGLIQATDGNLYGTTFSGGNNFDGTIFKSTTSGVLSTLYSFCTLQNCSDGSEPVAGVIQATDGNFYGTTAFGGLTTGQCDGGCGIAFKITPVGALTTLYSFCAQANCADGGEPDGVIQATDTNLYGTTTLGGTNDGGTVFQLSVPLPVSTFTPSNLNFGNQAMGVSSSPLPITLKNTGTDNLLITSIVDANGFSETNNCPIAPKPLGAGQSCTINVTFTPSGAGTFTDTLVVTDNSGGSPHQVPLSGVGQAPFTLTSNCTSLSVVPGQTAIYTVSLSPGKGFAQSVALACTGAPALANCTVSPTNITLDGSTTVQAQVTATTTPATSGFLQPHGADSGNRMAGLIGFAGLAGLAALVVLPGKQRCRQARRLCALLFCLCLLSTMMTTASCVGASGGDPPGTAAGTYPLTVTATFQTNGGTFTQQVSFNLVVQ